jgi:hypothetical protein
MTTSARLHVERTAEPLVFRWVIHDADVAAAGDGVCAVGSPSALWQMVADGRVRAVTVEHGDVLVEQRDAASVAEVHAAIVADLGSRAGWLTQRRCPLPAMSTAMSTAPNTATTAALPCAGCRRC